MGIKNLTFVDNSAPQCDAEFLNSAKSETNNFITSAGGSPTVSDLNQVSFSTAVYAAGADFYTDSGAADVYVASVVGIKKAPEAYFVGMRVRFVPGNTNTGASTVNVAGLGVKNIKSKDGTANPAAGDILLDEELVISYDGTNFRLVVFANLGSGGGKIQQVVSSAITKATGTTTIPNDNTTPTITEGTEIVSLAITPSSASNTVLISISIVCESAVSDNKMALTVFRGSTCIGANWSANLIGRGAPICFEAEDTPATASAVTYSVRFGNVAETDSWFMNRSSTEIFNNQLQKNSIVLMEVSA